MHWNGVRMERSDILYFYQSVIFNCGVLLFFIYLIVRKKKNLHNFERKGKRGGEKGQNIRKSELIFRACVIVISILFGVTCIPEFKDIPYAINEDFKTITGTVKGGDNSRNNNVRKRYISIVESGTNQEIDVVIRDRFINQGETMTVAYLPNSGFGSRVQTVIQERNKNPQNSEEKQQSGTGKLLGTLAGLTILIAVMRVGIKLLKKENDVEKDIVKMPNIYIKIGEFILVIGVFGTGFFIIYHAYMHVIMIGIPLVLIGIIFYYSTCHWKIIVNCDGIVIVHSLKPRQAVPFSAISKIVLKNINTINAEIGESMDIYVSGKKTTNLDVCYEGYQYLKEILVKNNIKIEQK